MSEVKPGFIDGHLKNPSYNEVCTGKTGHVEAVEVKYDSKKIPLKDLFFVFFNIHDPTTLNRQGNDIGTQYRSGIYFTETEQEVTAIQIIKNLDSQKIFDNPIVTEVKEATLFYKAEEHFDYYNQNKNQSYCNYVINPKVEKLKTHFSNLVKSDLS